MEARCELAPRSYDSLERAEAKTLCVRLVSDRDEGIEKSFLLHQDVTAGISCVLYDAGLLLAARLVEDPSLLQSNGTVLELGCGTACVGLAAAALGADVVCSDRRESALGLAERSAVDSGLEGVRFARWDWHEPIPEACVGATTIIAADVVYTIDTGHKFLSALEAASEEHCTILVMLKAKCDTGRAAIQSFLSEARRRFRSCTPLPLAPAARIVVENSRGDSLTVPDPSAALFVFYRFSR